MLGNVHYVMDQEKKDAVFVMEKAQSKHHSNFVALLQKIVCG
jgi:hypothetical protein